MNIHPTAIVHKTASIGKGTTIGPFSIIEKHAEIGDGCVIESHARIGSGVKMGEGNHIYQGAVIGGIPQDKKFKGEETRLTMGSHNSVFEYATISRGTEHGGGETSIGDGNLIMAYAHIAHDCLVGDRVVITNACQIAGHVEIEDDVVIGGASCVHQFCKIGRMTMVGGRSGITQDVVPFSLVSGMPAKMYGINLVGLKRNGLCKEEIGMIKKMHRILFREGLSLAQAIKALEEMENTDWVVHMLGFLKKSTRGITRKIEPIQTYEKVLL